MAVEKILLEFDADIKALRSDMNQVKSQLGDVEKQGNKTTSQLSSGFKRVGAAIGAAFSVQVLIQFTKRAVELYDIQAKAEAGLLQALKGREDVQRRLMRQASELQKITLFGDEETIRAQTMLARFGMTETQIKRLIPLIQDYATLTGQDLVSAADMVARSVGTSTNALSRYGIEIEGSVGSSERLESAISNLNTQIGGQAVAAAEAGAGAVEQFNMAWGDFAELVGEEVLPSIIAITGELKIFLEQLIDLKEAGDKGFIQRLFTEGAVGAIGFARDMGKARERLENATDYESIFNKAQDDFSKFVKNNKEQYSTLVDAATAYTDDLNAELRRVNREVAKGAMSDDDAFKIRKRISIVKDAVVAYVKDMENGVDINDKFNKSVLDLSESLDKIPKLMDKFYDPFRELPNEVERWVQALERIFGPDRAAENIINDFYDNLEGRMDELDEANMDFFEGILGDQADEALQKQREIAATYDILGSSIDFFSTMSSQATDRYLQDLQLQLDAGKITQEQFDRERKKELREQAKNTRALAVFDIVLNTSRAIMSFLAQPTPNVPGSIAAGVAGALQLTTAITQPLPAFATGTVDLKGEGTETSDSIVARLSKGESVITAKGTRQDKGLFEAANKLQLEDYINKNYVLPALVKIEKDKADMFDDYRLYMSLQNMKKSDKENTDKIVRAIKTEYTNSRRYWA